jgi:hypothetical protein
MNQNEYTDLIAGAHTNKPKFTNWVYALTEPVNQARKSMITLMGSFELNTAVGDQLDAIGARIGLPRELPIPIYNAFFALDDVDGIGLDLGVWKGTFESGTQIISLGDNIYRLALKAKIMINHFTGQTKDLYVKLKEIFNSFNVSDALTYVIDHQNMNVEIVIDRESTPEILWALLTTRILNYVSAGVGSNYENHAIRFGWDENSVFIRGWDIGKWQPLDEV